jgi:Leucine-rich repeat (LRR) protein
VGSTLALAQPHYYDRLVQLASTIKFVHQISPKCRKPINLLPTSVSELCSLRKLNLNGCNLFEDRIPIDLGSLPSLEELNLSRNNFRSLPHCIGRLPKLDILRLNEYTSLQLISELPASLSTLYASGCSSLQRLPNVPNQERLLAYFHLESCDSLAYDFRKSLLQVFSHALFICRYLSHFMM